MSTLDFAIFDWSGNDYKICLSCGSIEPDNDPPDKHGACKKCNGPCAPWDIQIGEIMLKALPFEVSDK